MTFNIGGLERVTFVVHEDGQESELEQGMRQLNKGDVFRLRATDPSDPLFGQKVYYKATSEPYPTEGGIWGVDAISYEKD